jgi:hypothetical protein
VSARVRLRTVLAAALLAACASAPSTPPPTLALPEPPQPAARLVLLGDAGRKHGAEHLAAVGRWIARDEAPTLVVFLGDNFYPKRAWKEAKSRNAILRSQREILHDAADVVFVPGNHDWRVNGSSAQVPERLAALASSAAPARWQPAPGEPGPALIERHGFRVIALDSDQWIAAREPEALRQAEASLRAAIACEGCARSIVVAHHPLQSTGPHGDCAGLLRRWLRIDQDLHSAPYRRYVRAIDPILRAHPPLLYAAGHDHSLQLAATPWGAHAVSGAGSEVTPVCGERAPLSWSANGFMSIERGADGALLLRVLRFGDEASCGATRFCEIHRQALPLAQ